MMCFQIQRSARSTIALASTRIILRMLPLGGPGQAPDGQGQEDLISPALTGELRVRGAAAPAFEISSQIFSEAVLQKNASRHGLSQNVAPTSRCLWRSHLK